MTLGEIIQRVQRLFGDESGAQITTDDIVRWANDAQLDIARHTEVLKKHAETNVAQSDGSYLLPDDIIALRRVTFDGCLLRSTTLDELDQAVGSREKSTYGGGGGGGGETYSVGSAEYNYSGGQPTQYYVWGNILYIYPLPQYAGVGNLDIWYVKAPIPLIDTLTAPELPVQMHEDIVRYCVARAKELDEDWAAAQALSSDYETRMAQARHETNALPENSYPAVRLLPGDDW